MGAGFVMFVFTAADALCCVWLIYPVLYWFFCPDIRTSSIDWTQMSMLLAVDRGRVQSSKLYFK